jgi:translation initiation factor 3 subunit A
MLELFRLCFNIILSYVVSPLNLPQVRVNVVSLASPRLQELYGWLEVDFHPLQLCSRVHTVVEELRADEGSPLQQYVPALQDVTLVRLIRQVSQVYQTIEITRLLELARFASAFHLERLLVDCVRHNDMQVRERVLFDRCHMS